MRIGSTKENDCVLKYKVEKGTEHNLYFDE